MAEPRFALEQYKSKHPDLNRLFYYLQIDPQHVLQERLLLERSFSSASKNTKVRWKSMALVDNDVVDRILAGEVIPPVE